MTQGSKKVCYYIHQMPPIKLC